MRVARRVPALGRSGGVQVGGQTGLHGDDDLTHEGGLVREFESLRIVQEMAARAVRDEIAQKGVDGWRGDYGQFSPSGECELMVSNPMIAWILFVNIP
ncbi:hypothetical protein KAREA_11520 [Prescottella equi]|nr:hypothetical protein KAREA_11520 [Prescottella equi]